MSENAEVESKNYKLMAKIYYAINENLNVQHISMFIENYDIHYRLPENVASRLRKPELIDLSVADCLINKKEYKYKLELLNVLMKKGLDITSRDAKGLTILHKAMHKHFKVHRDNWLAERKFHNEVIDFLLDAHIKTNNATNPRDEFGISHFHIACMANHVEAVNFFLSNGISSNEIVCSDSPQYPGYTPLHFAARYYSLEVADVLLRNHANLHVTDAKGMLPLHLLMKLCIDSTNGRNTYVRNNELSIVRKTIDLFLKKENENLEVNYLDDSGFSLLHAACAMIDVSMIENYLEKNYNVNAAVSMGSSAWPGYTALHFAAHFKTNAFKLLLENGGDIGIEDAKGLTPFDIILTRFGIEYIHAILTTHATWKDIVLSDGKTKLIDLVWALRDVRELETFLDRTSMDINVIIPIESSLWPGYNPLHLAILFSESLEIEMTGPIHTIPTRAVMYADKIKLLIERGADINSRELDGLTLRKLRRQSDCLDILYAIHENPEIMPVIEYYRLFDRNDDIYQTKTDIFQGLLNSLQYRADERPIFIAALKSDIDRQRQLEQDFGLTMLHIACWQRDIDWVKDLLTDANVNAQTSFDLPCWAGCSPLHVLLKKSALRFENDDRIDVILRLLLEKGADQDLTNARGSTLLHATEAYGDVVKSYTPDHPRTYANSPYTGLLLKRLEDFNFNPVNGHGISHFHIACIRNDVRVVEQFLQCGAANANTPVHLFSDKYTGCSPLHLAMVPGPFVDDSSRNRTMDLLISHGADVFAEDSGGNTLLHAAAKSNQPREGLLEKLIRLGLEVDAKNTFGERPLELLLLSRNFTTAELNVFSNRNCQLHAFNPINQKGYLSTIFRLPSTSSPWKNYSVTESKFLNVLTKIGNINKLDNLGRTIVHNFVSDKNCHVPASLINYLIDHGCDIDHRDNLGRTALHVASEFPSLNVKELLNAGADINVVDKNGESAFACSLKSYYKNLKPYYEDYIVNVRGICGWYQEKYPYYGIIEDFMDHIQLMHYCGLYVSDHIKYTQMEALKEDFSNCRYLREIIPEEEKNITISKQIEKAKDIKFGLISLYDFLSESRAMKACQSASPEEYGLIDDFLLNSKSQIHKEVDKVFYIAKRVYKKTSARLQFIQPAKSATSILVGFSMPDLCSEKICRFLSNKDLENLIASSST